MSRFKRLTTADLDRLTRGELLDRVEVEQQYWFRKLDRRPVSDADQAGYRKFQAIVRQAINPVDAVRAAKDLVTNGHGWSADYWDEIPGSTQGAQKP